MPAVVPLDPFLFSDEVRALVLDGVLDPVAWSTGRGDQSRTLPFSTRLGSAKGAYQTRQESFRLCDAGGPNCAFSEGDPHPPLRLAGQAAAPRAGRVHRPRDRRAVPGHLRSADQHHPQRAVRPLHLVPVGRDPPAAGRAHQPRRWRGRPAGSSRPVRRIEGRARVFCSETHHPSDVRAWRGRPEPRTASSPYFGRPWTWRSSICQPWPGWDRDHYDGPWNHRTANPVLVVGNRFDPATPYHGMVTVDRLLRGRGCSPWRLGPAGRP